MAPFQRMYSGNIFHSGRIGAAAVLHTAGIGLGEVLARPSARRVNAAHKGQSRFAAGKH